MADQITINSIDTSTSANGYVTVNVTANIGGTNYTPDPFVVSATDVPSVLTSVKSQGEVFKTNVASALTVDSSVATASLSSLAGTVINL